MAKNINKMIKKILFIFFIIFSYKINSESIFIDAYQTINPVIYWSNPDDDYDFEIYRKDAPNEKILVAFSDLLEINDSTMKQDQITIYKSGQYEAEIYKLEKNNNQYKRIKIDPEKDDSIVFRWYGIDKILENEVQILNPDNIYQNQLNNIHWWKINNNNEQKRIRIIIKSENQDSIKNDIYIKNKRGFLSALDKYDFDDNIQYKIYSKTKNNKTYFYQEIVLININAQEIFLKMQNTSNLNSIRYHLKLSLEYMEPEETIYDDDIKDRISIKQIQSNSFYYPIELYVSVPGQIKFRTLDKNINIEIIDNNLFTVYNNYQKPGNIKEGIIDLYKTGKYYILIYPDDQFEISREFNCEISLYFVPLKEILMNQHEIIKPPRKSKTSCEYPFAPRPAIRLYENCYQDKKNENFEIFPETKFREVLRKRFRSDKWGVFINNYEDILLNFEEILKEVQPDEQYIGKFGGKEVLDALKNRKTPTTIHWWKIDKLSPGPFAMQMISNTTDLPLSLQVFSYNRYHKNLELISYDEKPQIKNSQAIYEVCFDVKSRDNVFLIATEAMYSTANVCKYKFHFYRPDTNFNSDIKYENNIFRQEKTDDSLKYTNDEFTMTPGQNIDINQEFKDKLIYKGQRRDSINFFLNKGTYKIIIEPDEQSIGKQDMRNINMQIYYDDNNTGSLYSLSSQNENYLILNSPGKNFKLVLFAEYQGYYFSWYPVYYKLKIKKLKNKIDLLYTN